MPPLRQLLQPAAHVTIATVAKLAVTAGATVATCATAVIATAATCATAERHILTMLTIATAWMHAGMHACLYIPRNGRNGNPTEIFDELSIRQKFPSDFRSARFSGNTGMHACRHECMHA